jgi:hypothetical protein
MIKRILTAAVVVAGLSGCVAYTPYYVPAQPVYVQPRPVYVVPPVYYRPPPPVYYRPAPPVYYRPQCFWTQRWNPQYRTYQNVRVCR